ncbi:hypothetical protein [Parablautia muri]|nr:hypothetical protein [Parablautia muri]
MKVQNKAIFMGESIQSQRHAANEKKSSRSNIFAGDLNQTFDPIAQKKQQAQKKAMKIVTDTWAGDRKLDESLDERRNKIKELESAMKESGSHLKRINEERAALKETYGFTEDSQEEQDLRLLEKQADNKPLTKEEQERLAQIKEAGGPTEYQEHSLELYKAASTYKEEYEKAKKEIYQESSAIMSAKLERLKHDPMVKASKSADEIMEAARQEIIGMLYDDAKDHIDEEMEEKKEAADKKAEKEEEEEEKIEKRKEEKEEKEEFIEEISEDMTTILDADNLMDDVQREIKKIMDEMKLLDEDMKGAAVDTAG